jgi:hypothetical protein
VRKSERSLLPGFCPADSLLACWFGDEYAACPHFSRIEFLDMERAPACCITLKIFWVRALALWPLRSPGRGDLPPTSTPRKNYLGGKMVSVGVSVGVVGRCLDVRSAARMESRKDVSILAFFAVLHFVALSCRVACRDLKSSASAIPPPGHRQLSSKFRMPATNGPAPDPKRVRGGAFRWISAGLNPPSL